MATFDPRQIEAMIEATNNRIDQEMAGPGVPIEQQIYGRVAKAMTPGFVNAMVYEMSVDQNGSPGVIIEGFSRAFASTMLSLLLSLGAAQNPQDENRQLIDMMIKMVRSKMIMLLADFYEERSAVVGHVNQIKGGGRA